MSGDSFVSRYECGCDYAASSSRLMMLQALLLMLSGGAAGMVAYPLAQPDVRISPGQARTSAPRMVVPKAAALVLFAPWAFVITVNNLPTDLRLRIQKSEMLQQGSKMRTMQKTKPKVRGVKLTPEAKELTLTFKKVYPTRELELLWGALLKCYDGSQDLALQAARANPQILNPSYSFCNTLLESKQVR